MDLPTFRINFPEFSGVPDALITAKLAMAALEVDSQLFGTKFDSAHGNLTAHYLCTSPFGQNARMTVSKDFKADQDGTTVYWRQFYRIRSAVTIGFRVT